LNNQKKQHFIPKIRETTHEARSKYTQAYLKISASTVRVGHGVQ